ncbi:MAG: hypothetical protein QOI12_4631 [Alphaproteobacteria bacterium]|jgi:hypothetical protein|nr:hypothetical protein [Alphaproteobacteria bacterium]
MRIHNEARRAADWIILHDRIDETLGRFGTKDACGRNDYWLVDEDLGSYRLKLEVQNLNLLQPHIIKSLQALLDGYPDWEIMFRVDIIGKENEWPAMGVIIHDDEIIDDLQREFLPEQFRNIVYEGSKPMKKWP